MAVLSVVNQKNSSVSEIELPQMLSNFVRTSLLHSAVVNQLANKRSGTAATKNKALVSGGGKKPFKQKGTGRARAGSSRSPLWRHGGTVFGPIPRDYSYAMPKKMRKAALIDALSSKAIDSNLRVIDSLNLENVSTKNLATMMSVLNLDASTLFLISDENSNLQLSARNMPQVKVLKINSINVYDIIRYKYLVTDAATIGKLQEIYAK